MTQLERTEAFLQDNLATDKLMSELILAKHARHLARKLDAIMEYLRSENPHPFKPGVLGEPGASRTPPIAAIYEKVHSIVEGDRS